MRLSEDCLFPTIAELLPVSDIDIAGNKLVNLETPQVIRHSFWIVVVYNFLNAEHAVR